MDSLVNYMASKEINDPNSQYYIGQPSAIEQIQNYMRGVSGTSTNYFGGKTNIYPGQPAYDKFESPNNVDRRRNHENIFKAAIAGTAALLAGLALRKVPGVKPIAGLAWSIVKLPFRLVWGALKLGWKAIR